MLTDALKAALSTPPTPTQSQANYAKLRSKLAQSLDELGIPPGIAAALITRHRTPKAIRLAAAQWTGRCARTGLAFGQGHRAAALNADGEFVLRMIEQSQGTIPTSTFVAMCRRVVQAADKADDTNQKDTHGHDEHQRTALGLHGRSDRAEIEQRAFVGTGPASPSGGVWKWDDERGEPVYSTE